MASYTVSGLIKNPNTFSVKLTRRISAMDSSGELVVIATMSSGNAIAESGSYALSSQFTLSDTYESSTAKFMVYAFFEKEGYVDSETSSITLEKPSTTGAEIYGVSWTNDSTTTMTRTDDAVGLTYYKNTTTGEITSDFDTKFPFNEITKETDSSGNVWVNFPNMCFRIDTDSSDNITGVAVSKQSHSDGNWYEVKGFSVSAYGASGSSGAMKSVSGVSRLANITIGDLRSYIKATNSSWTMLDLYHKTILDFLWWIEFATKNSQSVMTGRTSQNSGFSFSSAVNTGGTDSLTTPSGYNTSTFQMRWHYIEDFIGNIFEWLDGIYRPETTVYYTSDKSYYADNTSGKSSYAGPGPNWIYAWHWDTSNPFLVVPSTTNSTEGGFSDYWYNGNSLSPVVNIGAAYHASRSHYGLVFFDGSSTEVTYSDLGGRILK